MITAGALVREVLNLYATILLIKPNTFPSHITYLLEEFLRGDTNIHEPLAKSKKSKPYNTNRDLIVEDARASKLKAQ